MKSGAKKKAGIRPYKMAARAQSAQATADRVLDVALELFTEKPYEDVSLDEVAERSRVAKRTVIRRFGSKEELFVAAMERAVSEMTHQREQAPVGDVAAAVSNVVDHYERWGTNRLRLLAQEDRIPVVAKHVQEGRRLHWGWVEDTFEPLLRDLRGAAKKRRIAGLVVAADVYTWKLLRRDLGLSRAEAERTMVELIGQQKGAA